WSFDCPALEARASRYDGLGPRALSVPRERERLPAGLPAPDGSVPRSRVKCGAGDADDRVVAKAVALQEPGARSRAIVRRDAPSARVPGLSGLPARCS